MNDRERWTVYPLLFLTLGIAVKDKIVRLTDADTVNCQRLIVHDRQNRPQVIIASTPDGGLLTDAETIACRRLIVQDEHGRRQVVIGSTSAGGVLRTIDAAGGLDVLLGHSDRVEGLMFVDQAGNLHNPSIIVPKPVKETVPEQAPPAKGAAGSDSPAPSAEPSSPPP
jgi:hypothetical protein